MAFQALRQAVENLENDVRSTELEIEKPSNVGMHYGPDKLVFDHQLHELAAKLGNINEKMNQTMQLKDMVPVCNRIYLLLFETLQGLSKNFESKGVQCTVPENNYIPIMQSPPHQKRAEGNGQKFPFFPSKRDTPIRQQTPASVYRTTLNPQFAFSPRPLDMNRPIDFKTTYGVYAKSSTIVPTVSNIVTDLDTPTITSLMEPNEINIAAAARNMKKKDQKVVQGKENIKIEMQSLLTRNAPGTPLLSTAMLEKIATVNAAMDLDQRKQRGNSPYHKQYQPLNSSNQAQQSYNQQSGYNMQAQSAAAVAAAVIGNGQDFQSPYLKTYLRPPTPAPLIILNSTDTTGLLFGLGGSNREISGIDRSPLLDSIMNMNSNEYELVAGQVSGTGMEQVINNYNNNINNNNNNNYIKKEYYTDGQNISNKINQQFEVAAFDIQRRKTQTLQLQQQIQQQQQRQTLSFGLGIDPGSWLGLGTEQKQLQQQYLQQQQQGKEITVILPQQQQMNGANTTSTILRSGFGSGFSFSAGGTSGLNLGLASSSSSSSSQQQQQPPITQLQQQFTTLPNSLLFPNTVTATNNNVQLGNLLRGDSTYLGSEASQSQQSNNLPTLRPMSESEFSSIPMYLRRNMNVESVNSAVNSLNQSMSNDNEFAKIGVINDGEYRLKKEEIMSLFQRATKAKPEAVLLIFVQTGRLKTKSVGQQSFYIIQKQNM
ncbi:MAG: hypothetical protein EZS28_021642 [Streblomastix strix]|uniref:Uncharacterized protein n=1 Tax=Streblomastix strix TaxID=222440 RepID=A0A5J4VK33_9EUKA|nr:MAG: hypothetical protein EZS28_021642 [Streblomastix strix]